MALVKHLAFIDVNSGEIISIVFGPADLPPEGERPDGLYAKYIYEDLPDAAHFQETHYFDFVAEEWVERPEKPNPFAYWTTDKEWVWDSENLLNQIRDFRNQKLLACDWTALPDAPLSESEKTEALNYRQALRDLPSSLDMSVTTSIEDVTWPTPPSFLNIEI